MRSAQFDDIYFSVEDGLAETRHTFLAGNGLPQAWVGRARFCIAETGFGTGLNMLAAWTLFEETADPDERLELISVEKYPLSRDEIRAALEPWRGELGARLERMLAQYPLRIPGFHRLNLSPRVTLTLIFDDALAAFSQLEARVDAWFLDGFAPAKNPDMWTRDLYAQMARLSAPGASVATFTAAGEVRRSLAAAGFTVEKRPGYGRKRDMTVGRFAGEGRDIFTRKSVAVIGAGIAGLSAAWHLKRAGHDVVVYEQQGIAAGASGNSVGIINPKLKASPSAQGAYYSFAYDYAPRMIEDLGVFIQRVGSVHLETDGEKARKFAGYQTLGWHSAHMVHLSDASDAAGVKIEGPALFYPDGAMTSPRDVCQALAKDIDVRIQKIETLPEADAVIAANAWGASQFCGVPIGRVRGQTTRVAMSDVSARVKTNICYGGYFTPAMEGAHMCGATFQPWEAEPGIKPADTARNLEMLAAVVPALANLKPIDDWVGFRAASKDRYPLVGAHAGVYLSAAHGSHGLISGIAAGAVLAAAIGNESMPLPQDVIKSLNPARFTG